MPVHPAHPDPEQLAAWQAGDSDDHGGASVRAHVEGCADCARVVAVVERGRVAMAGLPAPELPAGLHRRLADAVQREAAEPVRLDDHRGAGRGAGRRGGRAAPGRRRRVAAFSVAAGLILLVAGLVPVLRHLGGGAVATQGATTASGDAAGGAGTAGALPVLLAPGGFSADALRSALAGDPQARSAYQRAAAAPVAGTSAGGPTPAAPQFSSKDRVGRTEGGQSGSATEAPAGGLAQAACVAAARDQAGSQSLRPAFFVETVYRGRTATVLVTVRADAPDQAELWAFPRGDCSAAPFAHEPATVTPP